SKNASLIIHKSPNQMLAGVVVMGPIGRGEALDRLQVNNALRGSKVIRGIQSDVVDEIISSDLMERLRNTEDVYCAVIAYGRPVKHGTDGWIEPLTEDFSDRRFELSESLSESLEAVDFREMGDFPFIEAGQPLLRLHPETPGEAGQTVAGDRVKPMPGKPYKIKAHSSVIEDAGNPGLWLAAISGLPVLPPTGVRVEPILKLKEVNIKTGHIRFDGSLLVTGDVQPGMKIMVSGDVKIGGLVDQAVIQAGGHIEIYGGVIGKVTAKDASERSHVHAKGDIRVKYAHEAAIKAGGNITIGSSVHHSDLEAGDRISVQGKGLVSGGMLKAVNGIEIKTAGAPTYHPTVLDVGCTKHWQAKEAELMKGMEQLDQQHYRLIELGRAIKRGGGLDAMKQKKVLLLEKRKVIQEQRDRLGMLHARLMAKIERLRRTRITVNGLIHPGVELRIAGIAKTMKEESRGQSIWLLDEERTTVVRL
ncbi:MAG: DUF342 domain-containing protein, partial [Marinospirillum sp.]|uniref:DUF342 domain-containing protein n=1 Tax=Marinospirillum sp. TaxID=2183934 RepID=UPI0019E4A9D7